jgi:hypothetical protein
MIIIVRSRSRVNGLVVKAKPEGMLDLQKRRLALPASLLHHWLAKAN